MKTYFTFSETLKYFRDRNGWTQLYCNFDRLVYQRTGKYSVCFAEWKPTISEDITTSQPIKFTRIAREKW